MTDHLPLKGIVCSHQDCPKHGKPGSGAIIKFGKSRQGIQRFQCKTCGSTFTATYGSLFYRRRTPPQGIMETLVLLAEGVSIGHVARAKKIKTETILSWLHEAAHYGEAVEAMLLTEYRLSQAQIKHLWGHLQQNND